MLEIERTKALAACLEGYPLAVFGVCNNATVRGRARLKRLDAGGAHVGRAGGRDLLCALGYLHATPWTLPSSVLLGLTKEIASFDSTQIAKYQLYQGNLSTFGEPLRSGLIKLMSPIRVEQR